MNASDVNNSKYILEKLIDRALLNSFVWVTNRCGGRPQEPDYVAALSTKFIKVFFNILVAVFPNYDFSATSVYCHQKPIVDINCSKKPELGDILFVYADRKQNGEILLNSLLLQAKVSNYSNLKLPSSEMHQLELYKNWPEFTYFRAGHLNGKKRNILPKSINSGAQYLLIDDDPITNGLFDGDGMFPMGCAVPDDILCINESFSKELISLLKFKAGRTFDKNPYTTEDGWSKMMWDLLKIAASSCSRRKNAKMNAIPRSSHLHTESMGNMTLLDEMLSDYKYIEDLSDEAGGSVVLVESRLKEEYMG